MHNKYLWNLFESVQSSLKTIFYTSSDLFSSLSCNNCLLSDDVFDINNQKERTIREKWKI